MKLNAWAEELTASGRGQGGLNVTQQEQDPMSLGRALAGHEDTVFDVAWIPRGSTAHKLGARLLSASHDLTLRAWGLSVAQVTHGTQGPI